MSSASARAAAPRHARPAEPVADRLLPAGTSLVLATALVASGTLPAFGADYTVRSGDTVSAIAKRHGSTVTAIVQANKLDSRAFIRAGQTLSIPGSTGSTATTAAPATTAPVTGSVSYTVVSGDTVSAIAKRHGSTVAAIVAANGLNSRALIRVGQQLTVPSSGATVTTTAPVTAATAAPAQTAPAPAETTPTTPAPAAPAVADLVYTVVSGDTVSGIAKRLGSTVAAIVSANGLNASALIRVGQRLTIPGVPGTDTTTTSTTTQLVGNTFAGRTYSDEVVAAANANKAALLAAGVPSKADMQALVVATAREMGVDPALAQAVAKQESGFNQSAVSPANAIGTMQVIPSSGVWASQLVGRTLNLLDPTDNVVAGVAILRQLLRGTTDLDTAIAGYYQGATSVKKYGMYADTVRYVANVRSLMTQFS